jgi:hypothetical protein
VTDQPVDEEKDIIETDNGGDLGNSGGGGTLVDDSE